MKYRHLGYLVVTLVFACPCLGEFAVNTRTSDNQTDAAVAMDAEGNFVVVWSSYRGDGDSGGVFGQRFDANCKPVGDEFQINTTTAGNQTEPAVAMDEGGNFVVVWHGPGVTEEDIFARRFDANGQAVGMEFCVNTTTDNSQLNPSVAMNDNGDFIIVWESMDQPEPNRPICCQSYDRGGLPVGPELVISDQPSICRHPDVALDITGEAIVVWTAKNSLYSVRVRHFAADGNCPSLSSKQINDGLKFTSLTRPSVAVDSNGNYVIGWDEHSPGEDYDNVYIKRYHFSHIHLHDEQFLVNTQQLGNQTNPSIAMCNDSFVVVWESDAELEGNQRNIFGQRFVNQGEEIGDPIPLGDEFLVNTYVVDDQKYPAVAMKENGVFVTVWQSDGQDGSGYGVFGELGPRIDCADFSGDSFVNFDDWCVLAGEWLEESNSLETDLIDDNKINERDLGAFCRQWLTPCYDCNEVDVYADGKIDFKDYGLWAGNWLEWGPGLDGDVTGDGVVDMVDLQAMVFHWSKMCN